jgi:hypothetical protein
MPSLAAPDFAAEHQAQEQQLHQPPPSQVVQLLPSGSHFQTRWFLHHRSRSSRESAGEPFFSYPAGRFLHAPGRQLFRSLHKGGTRSTSGNRLQGLTSDLIRSSSKASAQGGSCGGCLRPWFVARPARQQPCSPAPLYTVYSPCI